MTKQHDHLIEQNQSRASSETVVVKKWYGSLSSFCSDQ